MRRNTNRKSPVETVDARHRTRANSAFGVNRNIGALVVLVIVFIKLTIVTAAVSSFPIVRVGHNVTALATGNRKPITRINAVAARARCNADAAVVLLVAIHMIRKIVREIDMIKLRSRIIFIREMCAAIKSYFAAAIIANHIVVGVSGVLPEIVIISVMIVNALPTVSAIHTFPCLHIEHKQGALIFCIAKYLGEIPGTLSEIVVVRQFVPGFSCIVTIEEPAVFIFNQSKKQIVIHRRNSDHYFSQHAFWHSGILRKRSPVVAPINAFI